MILFLHDSRPRVEKSDFPSLGLFDGKYGTTKVLLIRIYIYIYGFLFDI
jgi:hypothetical protein